MNIQTHIEKLKSRGVKNHGSVSAWLSRAGVAESTYYRWLAGRTAPSTRTLESLEKAAAK